MTRKLIAGPGAFAPAPAALPSNGRDPRRLDLCDRGPCDLVESWLLGSRFTSGEAWPGSARHSRGAGDEAESVRSCLNTLAWWYDIRPELEIRSLHNTTTNFARTCLEQRCPRNRSQ